MYINEFTALKEERKKETSPQNKEIKKEEKDPPKKNKYSFFIFLYLPVPNIWQMQVAPVLIMSMANKVGISHQ